MEKIQVLERQTLVKSRSEEMGDTAPPRFVSKLRGTTQLVEGDRAHIECQIQPTNDPELIVEILHNGHPLKTGSRFRTLCDFGYVALDIESINPEDAGIYTIKLKNRLGEVVDSIQIEVQPIKSIQTDTMYADTLKKLSVLERDRTHVIRDTDEKTNQPPVFTKPLNSSYRAHEGGNLHLECRLIPVGDPSLKVEWFKDGQPMKMGSRFHFIDDFGFVSLDIHKVEANDCGTYVVRAVNENGEAQTSTIISVKSKYHYFIRGSN